MIKKFVLLFFALLFSVSLAYGGNFKVKEFYVNGDSSKACVLMKDWITSQSHLTVHIVSIYRAPTTNINYPSWFVVYYED